MTQAPFPYFGGKSRIAVKVWERLGDVDNYVEPFFGSGAMLLNAPRIHRIETVNDANGYIANFWRAVQSDPDAVAHYADWPANENDLHARHAWLTERRDDLRARLEGDPDYCDAKVAGWWCWGMCVWIGGEFCSGKGPWHVETNENGEKELVNSKNARQGVRRRMIHLGDAGKGVNRKRIQLGDAGIGVKRNVSIYDWMQSLSDRLARVRVCCGDWSRICGPSVTICNGLTAVFLDPPYGSADRAKKIYTTECLKVAGDVREWCLENGDNSQMRIALCGYEGEHGELESNGWTVLEWKSREGYGGAGNGKANENSEKERVWFSPHCVAEMPLFTNGVLQCS